MARLTNSIREDIVKSLIRATFKARGDKLASEETVLAVETRDAYLGEFKDQYLTLPEHLKESSHYMHVHLGRLGERHDNFHFHFHAKTMLTPYYGEQMRWSRGCNMGSQKTEFNGSPSGTVPKNTFKKELHTRLVKHAIKWEAFADDVKKLSHRVSEQLKACTTTEKLVAAWPEVAIYIPPALNPLTVVIDRTKTNEMIACMTKGTCK